MSALHEGLLVSNPLFLVSNPLFLQTWDLTWWWQCVFFFCTLLAVPVAFCHSSRSSFAAVMAMMPPNNETPRGQTWHPTPSIIGADNPWQEAEEATQESLPTSAAAQAEEIGEWTRWSQENPLQSESVPPTQGQSWAEQPNPSTSRAESEFDPVQGPFPDWEGSPPTPSKNREKIFCTSAGWIAALPYLLQVYSRRALGIAPASVCIFWLHRSTHRRSSKGALLPVRKNACSWRSLGKDTAQQVLSRKKARARSKSASPSNKWLGRRWMARPCHCQWSRLLELEWEARTRKQ